MDLPGLITATRRRAGVSSLDAMAADADITELINEALGAITTHADWPWMETTRTFPTVAGTRAYATGTRWVRTRQLQVDGSEPLQPETRRTLDYWFPDSTVRGTPQYWCVSGDQILLYPTPDAAVTVAEVFFQYEPELSGSATPLLPSWAHGAIVEWAASLLLSRLREEERAAVCAARAQDWLKRLRDDQRRSTAPPRIRVRSGGFL